MPAVVAGMAKLSAQLEGLGIAFTVDELAEGALVIAEYAEVACPVSAKGSNGNPPGFLRASLFVRYAGSDVEIGFEAPYASYVEFGTYKMAAQPYLRPALDVAQDEALKAVLDAVQARIRDAIA